MKSVSVPLAINHNNFDFVRLFAAFQVVVVHLMTYLPGLHNSTLLEVLSLFPGVPIFFFISGFLIGGSWIRNPNVSAYAASRLLRIFPALWVSCVFTLVMLLTFYRQPMVENSGTAAMWFVMQLSFLQSWNPPFLRGYGIGLANPSLWTIPVELCFYIVLPLLVLLGKRLGRLKWVLVGTALLSLLICYVATNWLVSDQPSIALVRKVLTVSPASFVSWLWMFLLGVMAQLGFNWIRPLVSGRFWRFFFLALAVAMLSLFFDLPPLLHLPGNEVGLGNALANGAACLAFAYSFPGLAARWLRGSDLSYGMYLFHLPITNVFVVTGVVGIPGAGGVFVATVVSAFLSWHLVEKRALAFKPRLQQFFSGERVLKGKVAT